MVKTALIVVHVPKSLRSFTFLSGYWQARNDVFIESVFDWKRFLKHCKGKTHIAPHSVTESSVAVSGRSRLVSLLSVWYILGCSGGGNSGSCLRHWESRVF